MKWIEIIELQSAESNCNVLRSQLQKLSVEMVKETGKRSLEVFSSVKIDSDFSIHLVHHSNEVEYCGSPLGLRLASALKEFGLVNHSIWVEINNKKSEMP